MRSPIRITGLLTFVVIVGVLFSGIALLLDPLVSRVIRTAGSEVIGAKVELESAEASIAEQKLALTNLAVADPRSPMFNLFQLSQLVMDIDGDALMWNKWVVDDLTVTDLYLNTPRSESGDYQQKWLDKSAWNPMASVGGFENLNLDNLPDAKTVVAQESLQTPAAIESFKQELTTTKQQFQERLSELPDEEKITNYETRLKDIKQKATGGNKLLGLVSQGKELKELQKDIKRDIALVKALKTDLSTAKQKLSNDLQELKQMPNKDLQRLKAKYSLSGNGVNEIVSSLFGEQIGGWAQQGWHYYQMVSPYLNSYEPSNKETEVKVSQHLTNRGRKVLFEDQNPLPNYLIKRAELSSTLQDYGIGLSGLIENLTSEPERWNKPMTVDLSGESKLLKTFNVKGLFDHRNSESSQDTINIQATGINLGALAAQPTDKHTQDSAFTIADGMLDLAAVIERKGQLLDGQLVLSFNSLKISSDNQESWQKQLIAGVNKLPKLSLTIQLSGDINAPDVNIKSADLSAIGSAMVRELASDKIAAFETELQQVISAETGGLLDDISNLSDISELQNQLDLKEVNLADLLKIK